MIVRTRHGDMVVERRDVTVGQMLRASGQLRGDGVSARAVAGLPAWRQAIRIASEAIARHRMCVWRGEDEERRRVRTTWQARFFAGRPNELYPWFYAWERTEASLTARGNAFWLKQSDDLGRVIAIYVLHPDAVEARWNRELGRPEYRVTSQDGVRTQWLGPSSVLHFRVSSLSSDEIIAPSPIAEHRRVLDSALARQHAEAEFYRDGSRRTTAVVFRGDVTPEQAERFRQVYLDTSSAKVKVFGGDPRIETIGLSLADQQFVESQAFGIEDIGRILGVPPSLLWATRDNMRPAMPEHEEDRWVRYGLEPRRQRIEQTIAHDPSFFGPGARDYPAFNVRRVRGDALTESQMVVREVQAGLRTPNEGRAELGLPPHPDGDILQITPVGGAPNEPGMGGAPDSEDDS